MYPSICILGKYPNIMLIHIFLWSIFIVIRKVLTFFGRNNPDVPEILYVGDSTKRLLEAGFDPSHDTVLYAHGFNRTFEDFASNFTTCKCLRIFSWLI